MTVLRISFAYYLLLGRPLTLNPKPAIYITLTDYQPPIYLFSSSNSDLITNRARCDLGFGKKLWQ